MEACYSTLMALTKTGILLFYARIFGVHPAFRTIIYILIFVVWAWCAAGILTAFLLCAPFPYNWDTGVAGGHCGNRVASFVANGAVNMLTDCAMLILPIPYIWKLQMSVYKRVGMTVYFCLGIFTSAISIIRMMTLVRLQLDDYTYNVTDALLCSLIECELATIVANIPFIRPVLVPLCGWLATTKNSGSGASDPFAHNGDDDDDNNEAPRPSRHRRHRRSSGHLAIPEGGRNIYRMNALDRTVVQAKSNVEIGGHEIRDTDSTDSQIKIAERGAMPGRCQCRPEFRHSPD